MKKADEIYKTREQIEFIDLMRHLKEQFNYNQEAIARAAKCSPSMITQIVKGARNPGRPSLELLRRTYEDLTKPEAGPVSTEPDRLQEKMDFLQKNDRAGYEAAKLTVETLHAKAQAIQGVSSKVASAAEATQSAASEAAKSELLKPQHSPTTGASTGRRRGRARGAPQGSKDKPATPKQAPK